MGRSAVGLAAGDHRVHKMSGDRRAVDATVDGARGDVRWDNADGRSVREHYVVKEEVDLRVSRMRRVGEIPGAVT